MKEVETLSLPVEWMLEEETWKWGRESRKAADGQRFMEKPRSGSNPQEGKECSPEENDQDRGQVLSEGGSSGAWSGSLECQATFLIFFGRTAWLMGF